MGLAYEAEALIKEQQLIRTPRDVQVDEKGYPVEHEEEKMTLNASTTVMSPSERKQVLDNAPNHE